jgi:hypothetical protein
MYQEKSGNPDIDPNDFLPHFPGPDLGVGPGADGEDNVSGVDLSTRLQIN